MLPSQILRQSPDEFYLNLVVTYPEALKKKKRLEERRRQERRLGYNPIKKLLDFFRACGTSAINEHGKPD